MDIATVINYLNKKLGYELTSEYYTHIHEWECWWRGYFKPFHEFTELNGKKTITRDMYTLKMAKKVCEDWASLLLNDKTQIVITHNASSEFVQGKDSTGGVFGDNDFWVRGNELVERAFMSGTGAFVLRIENMSVANDKIIKDKESKIRIECLQANHIIPLTIKQRKIIDVAFVSEVLQKGEKFIYIETHILKDGEYQITNSYFKEEEGTLMEQPLPEGIIESFSTGSDIPMFAIVAPNIVNNIDSTVGLGISIFADAIDNLKGVDLAYNNFNRDLKLGGKKVFLSAQLTQTDENGNTLTPDDVAQQLFIQVTEDNMNENGTSKQIFEYNPSLRVGENKDGIQAQLDYLSFKVGFGTKHYQFNAGSIVTATQYMGDKQELVQNANKHYISIERSLKGLVRGILWIGKEVLGNDVNPDAQVTINFEDSYIIDKEAERMRDLQEISAGIKQRWEYRVKWYGEDEETAKKMTGYTSDDQLLDFGSEEDDEAEE